MDDVAEGFPIADAPIEGGFADTAPSMRAPERIALPELVAPTADRVTEGLAAGVTAAVGVDFEGPSAPAALLAGDALVAVGFEEGVMDVRARGAAAALEAACFADAVFEAEVSAAVATGRLRSTAGAVTGLVAFEVLASCGVPNTLDEAPDELVLDVLGAEDDSLGAGSAIDFATDPVR